MDPRTRLWLVGVVGVLAVALESPAALGVLAACSCIPLAVIRPDRRWVRRGLVVVLTIVWSTTLSQGIFYAEQPRVSLGHLGPLHLYREGLGHGLAQSLRFIAVSMAGIGLAVSTPPDRLTAALIALRVPFGLSLMASTALRFLPEIARESLTVRQARAMRGRPAWRRAPWRWVLLELALLRPVVARAWRRAQNLAESLDARGFDPLSHRKLRRGLVLKPVDYGLIGASGLVMVALVAARLVYLLYVTDTWYHPALRGLIGLTRAWL